jgi:hypothetical protein
MMTRHTDLDLDTVPPGWHLPTGALPVNAPPAVMALVGTLTQRRPDQLIGGDYLARWFIQRNKSAANLYLHCLMRDDDDRALHDHPWVNTSIVLAGSYREITPAGTVLREPGAAVHREAEALHRLEVVQWPVWSLFVTGPKTREWGFQTPGGWVHWRDFVPVEEGGRGLGCDAAGGTGA